jgi:hypothetical protein
MHTDEVVLYASQGKDGPIDSAKVSIEGQTFLCRLVKGKIVFVGRPRSPVRAWRDRARVIAHDRITKAQKEAMGKNAQTELDL